MNGPTAIIMVYTAVDTEANTATTVCTATVVCATAHVGQPYEPSAPSAPPDYASVVSPRQVSFEDAQLYPPPPPAQQQQSTANTDPMPRLRSILGQSLREKYNISADKVKYIQHIRRA